MMQKSRTDIPRTAAAARKVRKTAVDKPVRSYSERIQYKYKTGTTAQLLKRNTPRQSQPAQPQRSVTPRAISPVRKAFPKHTGNSITGAARITAKTESKKGNTFTYSKPTIDTALPIQLRIRVENISAAEQ